MLFLVNFLLILFVGFRKNFLLDCINIKRGNGKIVVFLSFFLKRYDCKCF